MKEKNWFAKSKNWIEPDDKFLNAVYMQLKEFNKKDHTPTSLNYNNVIILVVSFKQNLKVKIQMLVGNSLISFLNASSEENSTLVHHT